MDRHDGNVGYHRTNISIIKRKISIRLLPIVFSMTKKQFETDLKNKLNCDYEFNLEFLSHGG